jgi:hypothetical protein
MPTTLAVDVPAAEVLSVKSLSAWAAAPGQLPSEKIERAAVVSELTDSSFLRGRTLKPVHNLDLTSKRNLTSLPEGLSIPGDLIMRGWPALARLPRGLSIGGSLSLIDCPILTQIPEGISVAGNLNISNCNALAQLPKGLSIKGSLNLRGCTALIRLPDKLSIGDNLYVLGCTALAQLPESLSIKGSLDLWGCNALAQLPAGLSIRRNLNVWGCTALTQLPQDVSIRRNLTLRDCTALAGLPEELSISGQLDLGGCTALTQLPDDLSVAGHLKLNGCTGLAALPEGLVVEGEMNLSGCTSLSQLPEHVLQWPLQRDGHPHIIDISGSGIGEASLLGLQNTAGAGVQLVCGVREVRSPANPQFASLSGAMAFWRPLASSRPQTAIPNGDPTPVLHADPRQLADFLSFLDRLRGTADYQNGRSRPLLARRIVGLIDELAASESLAALCHERVGQALESCGDRVIWALNQLELTVRVHQAQQGSAPEQELRNLGRSLLRLQVVHQHAAEKVATLRSVDPIEVYLAYETRLAQPLELPLSTREMLYERSSMITAVDLEAASLAAREADADPQQIEAYLATWEPWQALSRRQQAGACTWQGLPELPPGAQIDGDQVCVVTQETLADLQASGNDVAAVRDLSGRWRPYDFVSLLKWWSEQGTHPVHGNPMRLEDIHRLNGRRHIHLPA